MSARHAIISRNAAMNVVAALCNSGYLRYYTGAKPATPETAASGTQLCELRFAVTAFGAASNGVLTANAIVSDTNAANTGTAGWFRIFKSDGTSAVLDGDIGVEIIMNSDDIQAGAQVDCTSLTITLPM